MTRTRSDKSSGWASAIGSGIVTFVMIGLLGLAVALVVVPKAFGGLSLTVLTGSMEPGIAPGDVVVTRGVDMEAARDLKIGDVITFLPYPDDPTLVTHRIIAKTASAQGYSFVTQGDNNTAPDVWNPVQDYQIRGEVLYVVPKIGHVRAWFGPAVSWIIPAIGVLLIAYAAVGFALSFRKEKTPALDGSVGDAQAALDAADTSDEGEVAHASPRRAFCED
ncbi:MAG: signal peptidase I [Propionibacteriaceae bacterium]|jgi:signal peptidase|nr:signal peptidase I [Propionibacteriaceae bacterium]